MPRGSRAPGFLRAARCVFAAALLAACTPPPRATAPAPPAPDVRLREVTVRSWRGDTAVSLATADVVDLTRGSNGWVASDAGVELLARGASISATTLSGVGDQTAHAAGDVRLSTREGLRARTSQADYSGPRGSPVGALFSSLEGKAPLRAQSGSGTLEAASFSCDLYRETCTFERPVTTLQPTLPAKGPP